MGTNKRILGLSLVFLGLMAVFSIIILQTPAEKEAAEEAGIKSDGIDFKGIEFNGIEAHSSMVARAQPSNPIDIFSADFNGGGRDTEVTVYNQDLALVKEKRELELKTGVNHVEYTDVASWIDPTSVMFEDTKNKDTIVLEQNYEYDVVSTYKLLEKFLGKKISATDEEGNTYTGTLLSRSGGIVIQQKDGTVVALDRPSKIEYPDAANLLTKPTLIWEVYSSVPGKRDVLTSYLTGGMSWEADYILKTNADDTKADLKGWVSLDNQAGTTYEDAKLKLVAGEVHRVYEAPKVMYDVAVNEAIPTEAPEEEGFVEESLFEYHLYTLDRPATLKDKQIKQLALLSADTVPVEKELVFDGQKSDKVEVVLNLENSEAKGLGMPLPAGTVRVYKADSEGQLQFLGEDRIDHTPKDEEIEVVVGKAFDVSGERTRTDYERVSENLRRESYEIKLKNHKKEAQSITVIEHFYGDWEITKTSEEYEKTDAFTAKWKVKVPANGEKTISYTLERKF